MEQGLHVSGRTQYENDPVVRTIRRLLDQNGGKWEGTAGQLLKAGADLGFGRIAPTAQKLGYHLRELEAAMERYDGIEHHMTRTSNGSRNHIFCLLKRAVQEDMWQEADSLILPF